MATHEKWLFIAMPEALKTAAAQQDADAFEQVLLEVMGSDGNLSIEDEQRCRPAGLSTQYAKMLVSSLQEGSWLGTWASF